MSGEKGVETFRESTSSPELLSAIKVLKKELSSELVILGHHYQRDDVLQFADITGDSLILSRKAAEMQKKHIVFCGVYFMAECADILTEEDQAVYIPDLEAGCAMADMAGRRQVEETWGKLTAVSDETIIPVTYINSSADIKAFVGERGGLVCTSSNAGPVFDRAMELGSKILFLPDRYLGANTALHKGMNKKQLWLLDRLPDRRQMKDIRVFLWDGYCSVHRQFRVEDVYRLRKEYPGIRIIVHGECSEAVVQASDDFGSTSAIIQQVSSAPAGSIWGVGTEEHLVRRLKKRFPDKTVLSLSGKGVQCTTMYRITPEKLQKTLQGIRDGGSTQRIRVNPEIKHYAKSALMRMLSL
ncbi:MAG: quinolinate synthase NadA [Candidatus Marinimicrobia bacterium]|nr:quinolinate synthase NadA [Candidatus Neomarinimicrobiota bacterium]